MTVDLSYFYMIDEASGEEVLASHVVSHKTKADLKLMILKGRNETAIEKHAEIIAQAEQWDWLEEYNSYLIKLKSAESYNANLPVIDYDENEQPITAEPKELPIQPNRPLIRTGKDLLESLDYYTKKFKDERASKVAAIKTDVEGVVLDGDEESQTRLTRAIVILLAQKLTAVEKAITSTTSETTTEELLTSLKEAVSIDPTTLWKTADNGVTELNCEKAIMHAMQAGTKQSDMWGMNDATE